ncbi:DsrE/DsrF-like family protein [Thiocapsa imhoffii]|uniref:DsrE/DsrF-like family protein n=2 Tax=Thiocapsa imhoffii TaxID=382777 RepID=A0A9X0WGB3_9GAMM|nr:DsrE/DsrF-like family protein [Thiocapsa imhoffii]
MRLFSLILFGLAVFTAGLMAPAWAGDEDPLFINLTSDDPHRADMAITFGERQFERGHPLTIFLNDKGVWIGARAQSEIFGPHQVRLGTLIEQGARVLICPMCMKHYGVTEEDVIPGVQLGNPELTGGALFAEDTKTLTW